MSRTPINYSKTIIYKIAKYDEEDPVNIYIGHTTDFACRKGDHSGFVITQLRIIKIQIAADELL